LVLREGTTPYQYLYGDHLNSATLTTDAAGTRTSETRYYPYGAHRYDWGSDPSERDFTGQRRDAEIALLDYVARRYSPYLGRFVSPDSVVPQPGNPQSLNRYSYVLNNPLRYTDPTGHVWRDDDSGGMWRWWEEGSLSIYTLQPGGSYTEGSIVVGPKNVSVYRPPTVTGGLTTDGLQPVYRGWASNSVTDHDQRLCYPKAPYSGPSISAAPVGDAWYGEPVNGGTSVRPNTWRLLASFRRQEGPQGPDLMAGITRGTANAPVSLMADPNDPPIVQRSGAAADAVAMAAYGWQGAAQAQWVADYFLQESISKAEYRVIILARQLSVDASQSMYRTYNGFYPVYWGSGPFLR